GTGSTLDPLSTDTTAPASLVKLAIPVNGTVTKKFGWVADATTGIKRYHEGIDIKAPEKSKVSSILDGKVTKLGEDPDLGKYIIITHDGDLVSLYGQLAQVNVKQSELVKAGDVIGLVGKTGTASEPHLHLEIREKGEAIDPWLKLSKEGI
ncbi:MAG TPA: M23 family metallopeptidase, partial [Bacillota bacterium]|nr:M23 family metallopeptidase [Bacillota bacterium]